MRLPYRSTPLSRRGFLKLMAAAVGGVAVGGVAFRGSRYAQQPRADVMVVRAGSYEDDLYDLLLRGTRQYPALVERCRGAKVLLKPNFVDFRADGPANTHPAVIGAAVAVFRTLGAREVIVAEGAGLQRDAELLLEYSGLGRVLHEMRAPFVDLNLDGIAPVSLTVDHTGLGRLFLPRTVLDADLVVSMPKMKTHKWAGVTLSLKNMFGIVPGVKYGWPKNVLHWHGIDQSIWDICLAAKPAFAIIDGIVGMQGNGPLDGEAISSGVIVLGDNLTAVDATAARLMGIQAERITYLIGMMRYGGTIAQGRIAQLGETLPSVCNDYRVVPHLELIKKPSSFLHWLYGM